MSAKRRTNAVAQYIPKSVPKSRTLSCIQTIATQNPKFPNSIASNRHLVVNIRTRYQTFFYLCNVLQPNPQQFNNSTPQMLCTRNLFHSGTVLSIFDTIDIEQQLAKLKSMSHEDKQAKASEIIRNHVGFSLGAALVPFPGADLLAVSAVQLNMMRQLAKLYNVGFFDTLGKNVISAVAGGGVARLGASLIKIIPGVGTVIGELSMPILSGASTYALGHVVAAHFQKGGSLDDLDLKMARKSYETEIENGKKMAEELRQTETPVKDATDSAMDKLTKLAELHRSGILTDEEFAQMKAKLLSQL